MLCFYIRFLNRKINFRDERLGVKNAYRAGNRFVGRPAFLSSYLPISRLLIFLCFYLPASYLPISRLSPRFSKSLPVCFPLFKKYVSRFQNPKMNFGLQIS